MEEAFSGLETVEGDPRLFLPEGRGDRQCYGWTRRGAEKKNGNIVVDFNLLFTSNKYRLFTLASAFWPLWPLRQAVFCPRLVQTEHCLSPRPSGRNSLGSPSTVSRPENASSNENSLHLLINKHTYLTTLTFLCDN